MKAVRRVLAVLHAASVLGNKLAKGLSQNDIWVSEKVWMRCESVVNMTDLSVLTASPQSSECVLAPFLLPGGEP